MMGQIEVLYDLGEPYVRLEDYRAIQARAAALAAEVERLGTENVGLVIAAAEREQRERTLLDESGVGIPWVHGGTFGYVLQNLRDSRNYATAAAAEIAALRGQLAAEEGWRSLADLPPSSDWVQVRGQGRFLPVSGWVFGLQEWRPAPPQE